MSIEQKWQQVAIEIGNGVYRLVNSPETVGTDDETGYILMFFNVRNHGGKSTLVSTETDRRHIKKLLKTVIESLDGPKTKIVPPDKYSH